MNKRLIVTSFSTCMLMFYTSYAQSGFPNYFIFLEENTPIWYYQDSSILPIDSASLKKIRSNLPKSSRYSRYKDLQRERERRKKIREKYNKEKLSKD